MKVVKGKSFLKGYGPGIKVFGSIAIVTTMIVGGFFGYKVYKSKTQTNTAKTTSTNSTTSTSTTQKNYDGRYAGAYTVANGISAADVTVSASTLSGTASYTAPDGSKIPLKVTGTVQRGDTAERKDGNVACNFSGSGTILGQKATVTGVCFGHIISTTMNVSYSATAFGAGQGQTYPGQITLSKK